MLNIHCSELVQDPAIAAILIIAGVACVLLLVVAGQDFYHARQCGLSTDRRPR